jgi:dihydroxyacid dehydratase/phosphogluconate dehydratase
MLYAAGVPDKHTMKTAPHVGIASVWWEGNPCNMHLLDLGKEVKKAITNQGMLGWQYNTIGVSDAITMGGEGISQRHRMAILLLIDIRHEILPSDSRDHRRQHRNSYVRSIS